MYEKFKSLQGRFEDKVIQNTEYSFYNVTPYLSSTPLMILYNK